MPERLEAVPLENIRLHPRARPHDPEKLAELTASLKDRGQLQPARGRPKDDAIELYIGGGRYRAAQALQKPTLDILISDRTDEEVDVDMLHENLKREDLDPITEAREYDYMIRTFNWNQAEMANRAGMSPQAVSETLALLNLSPELQKLSAQADISKKHGYYISKLTDQATQLWAARQVIDGHLTTEQTSALVSSIMAMAPDDLAHHMSGSGMGETDKSLNTPGSDLAGAPKPTGGSAAVPTRAKAPLKNLSRLWPGLPAGVYAKLEKGWVTLRWSPSKYAVPKILLEQLLATAPELLAIPKRGKLPSRKKVLSGTSKATAVIIDEASAQVSNSQSASPAISSNGGPDHPNSIEAIAAHRVAVAIPQVKEAHYVGGNKLRVALVPLGDGFTYRFFRTRAGDPNSIKALAEARTVSTPGAIVNAYAGGDTEVFISVMAIDAQGNESELSKPIQFELKPWNDENTLEPLPTE